jgi:tetratricopeptide (TPR) repeat protein
LYNLAVLLEEKVKRRERELKNGQSSDLVEESEKIEVLTFYQQASLHDPHDATALSDYGRYMLTEFGKEYQTKAETALHRALQMNPHSEVALSSLAILHFRYKKDAFTADNILRKLLTMNPKHLTALHLLATILFDLNMKLAGKAAVPTQGIDPLDEAFALYEKAITVSRNPSQLMIEYCGYAKSVGSNKHRLAAVAFCSQVRHYPRKTYPKIDTI